MVPWDPGIADPPPDMLGVLGYLWGGPSPCPMLQHFLLFLPERARNAAEEKGNFYEHHSPFQPFEIGENIAKCPP